MRSHNTKLNMHCSNPKFECTVLIHGVLVFIYLFGRRSGNFELGFAWVWAVRSGGCFPLLEMSKIIWSQHRPIWKQHGANLRLTRPSLNWGAGSNQVLKRSLHFNARLGDSMTPTWRELGTNISQFGTKLRIRVRVGLELNCAIWIWGQVSLELKLRIRIWNCSSAFEYEINITHWHLELKLVIRVWT